MPRSDRFLDAHQPHPDYTNFPLLADNSKGRDVTAWGGPGRLIPLLFPMIAGRSVVEVRSLLRER